MKKLAIAVAVSALAVSAQAQNVSVYGILDTGFQQYDNGTESLTRATDGRLSTGRLGFKGSEDLGGGLKTNFVLEGTLATSTGTVGSTTANQIFNREATVGLAGGMGEIKLGRQDTTSAQDIDIAVSQFGNFGLHATNGTAVELGTDQNNTVRYISPKVGGLTVQAGYTSGNSATTTTDAQADAMGVHAKFETGALTLHAGYQTLDAATEVAKRDFTAFGASYNLGIASVGLAYAEGDVSTTGDVKSTAAAASVKVPLSNGLAFHGVYSQAKDGTQSSNGKGTGYAVGLTKTLSKRTTMYAAYTSVDNEANSSMAMAGTTAPTTAGLDTKATVVGITHSF